MMIPKRPKPVTSKAHVSFLHSLICCICGNNAVEQHHILRAPSRHGTKRAGDQHSLPLCGPHHRELHLGDNTENGFAERHNVSLLEIADFLYQNTGDAEICEAYLKGVSCVENPPP